MRLRSWRMWIWWIRVGFRRLGLGSCRWRSLDGRGNWKSVLGRRIRGLGRKRRTRHHGMADNTLQLFAICDICILNGMYVHGNECYLRDLELKARDEQKLIFVEVIFRLLNESKYTEYQSTSIPSHSTLEPSWESPDYTDQVPHPASQHYSPYASH
jgi:hypothetical protein